MVEKRMRAVVHETGAPLGIAEALTPVPKAGEVLIRVEAAGVNRADLLQRSGRYPPPPGASEILGLEASGVIAAMGPDARRWREGDRVCALLAGGGYAEYVAVPEGSVLPVPAALSAAEAASLPEAFFTVWANVFEHGRLQKGETVLLHGGASGIGVTGIQMARAFGARVFVTAGDPAKTALCQELGAERAINYRAEDFEAVVRGLGGADVILDMVGGAYVQKNIDILNEGGRLVQIAFLQGPSVHVNLMRVMMKRLTLTGSTLRGRSTPEKSRLRAAIEEHAWPWAESGAVRPVIDSAFPLEEAEAAHKRMASGEHAGKIVLTL